MGYLTDEQMDEWGMDAELDRRMEQREETEMAEELDQQVRSQDYQLAFCEHRDTGIDMRPDQHGRYQTICYDCGTQVGGSCGYFV